MIHGDVSGLWGQREQKVEEETCSLCSGMLSSPVPLAQENAGERPGTARPDGEEGAREALQAMVIGSGDQPVMGPGGEPSQARQAPSLSRRGKGPRKRRVSKTIEQAIEDSLQDQSRHHRCPKTLEWHQMALGFFQQYLLMECHCTLLSDLTETDLRGWVAFLRQQPTSRGNLRATGTITSYLRSARAFCQWCVRHTFLKSTPFAHLPLLQREPSLLQLLEPEEWEGLLVACRPPGEIAALTERATARNQAILWVLADTGMRASELCELQLEDVDREQGLLTVRGKGSKQRQLPLGQNGLPALLSYLEPSRPERGACVEREEACEEPLFLSEAGRRLTDNGIALLFGRLRKRAGIARKDVGASLLRETFAMQYLQAGGDRFLLRELLGQEESAAVKRSLRRSEEAMEDQKQKKPDHLPR